MAETQENVYEQAFLQQPLGETLHPGGLKLTGEALSLCDLPAGGRILDLGCGTGTTVQYLQGKGFQAVGMDISDLLLHSFQGSLNHPIVLLAEACRMPFASNSMDAVIAECSLSEFPQTDPVLREIHRVLKTGGRFIITDLYVRDPSGLPKVKRQFPKSCFSRSFVQNDLCIHLGHAGFEITNWKDRSDVLKSLSSGWTMSTFTGSAGEQMDPLDTLLILAGAKIGYFVCIAAKTKQHLALTKP